MLFSESKINLRAITDGIKHDVCVCVAGNVRDKTIVLVTCCSNFFLRIKKQTHWTLPDNCKQQKSHVVRLNMCHALENGYLMLS